MRDQDAARRLLGRRAAPIPDRKFGFIVKRYSSCHWGLRKTCMRETSNVVKKKGMWGNLPFINNYIL
jgi:hypothetical protein